MENPELRRRATIVVEHIRHQVSKSPSSPYEYWGAIDLRKEHGEWKAYYYLVHTNPSSVWWLEDISLPELDQNYLDFPSSSNDNISKSL
jgi:hypothetical protein